MLSLKATFVKFFMNENQQLILMSKKKFLWNSSVNKCKKINFLSLCLLNSAFKLFILQTQVFYSILFLVS